MKKIKGVKGKREEEKRGIDKKRGEIGRNKRGIEEKEEEGEETGKEKG